MALMAPKQAIIAIIISIKLTTYLLNSFLTMALMRRMISSMGFSLEEIKIIKAPALLEEDLDSLLLFLIMMIFSKEYLVVHHPHSQAKVD